MVSISAGTDWFGKVDRVAGLGYVATQCQHLCGLPLLPERSYLIVTKFGGTPVAIPIPFSRKSYCIAWVRLLAFVVAFASSLFASAAVTSPIYSTSTRCIAVAISVASIGTLLGSMYLRPFRRANPQRASELTAIAQKRLEPTSVVPLEAASTTAKESAFQEFLEFARSKGADIDAPQQDAERAAE
jgi:hypothetical protein